MTIDAHSLSNVVTGAGLPLSGPTEDPDWQMSVFGVRAGADRCLERLSSTAFPARPVPTLEVGHRGRATAAWSHLFNTRLIRHYGQFEDKGVFDCLCAKSVQMVVSR
jgi:hypothetical protein